MSDKPNDEESMKKRNVKETKKTNKSKRNGDNVGQKRDNKMDEKNGQNSNPKNEPKDDIKEAKKTIVKDVSPQSDVSRSSSSSSDSSRSISSPLRQAMKGRRQPSTQSIASSLESDHSMVTLESLKYLQILDQYVSGKHWNFDMEYILSCICGIIWSLLITFFTFYDIDDKCWNRLTAVLSLSVMISAFTAVELVSVAIVWYISLIIRFANRSRICTIVIVFHILCSFFNLLIAVIEFGSRTCHEWGELHPERRHLIVVRYEVKMIGFIHCIVSVNLMLCAMLLAIKRNDFKFYVLWRKGLLNQYLMLEDD